MANGEDIKIDTVKFTVRVGDLVKIERPKGYPPVEFEGNPDPKQYLNGFVIMYPELGEFEDEIEGTAVYYRHNLSGKQIIEYISRGLGRYKFRAELEGIIVHDHSSVHTGGPAFATYYAEVPTEET